LKGEAGSRRGGNWVRRGGRRKYSDTQTKESLTEGGEAGEMLLRVLGQKWREKVEKGTKNAGDRKWKGCQRGKGAEGKISVISVWLPPGKEGGKVEKEGQLVLGVGQLWGIEPLEMEEKRGLERAVAERNHASLGSQI